MTTKQGSESRPPHWNDEEDAKLLDLYVYYSRTSETKIGLWTLISGKMDSRSPKQCRERYINHLQPGVDKSPLTDKEWKQLDELHDIYGNKWSDIVLHFPSRTANHIKNQWNTRLRRLYSTPQKKTRRRRYRKEQISYSDDEEETVNYDSDQVLSEEDITVPITRKRMRQELLEQWEQNKRQKCDDSLCLLYLIAQGTFEYN